MLGHAILDTVQVQPLDGAQLVMGLFQTKSAVVVIPVEVVPVITCNGNNPTNWFSSIAQHCIVSAVSPQPALPNVTTSTDIERQLPNAAG